MKTHITPSFPLYRNIVISLLIALISISCGGGAPATYSIGGSINGLGNKGLVLQNNGGDDLSISNGSTSFSFATALTTNSAYAVSVKTQPVGQICSVESGSGTVAVTAITSVSINCELIDQEIKGLYQGNGTISFSNISNGSDLSLINVKGIIGSDFRNSNGDVRFMFFNIDPAAGIGTNQNENVLIDGVITNVTLTYFTATASVYQAGRIVANNVAITGTVTMRDKISLSLAPTTGVTAATAGDLLVGTIDVDFYTQYDKPAFDATIDTEFAFDFGAAGVERPVVYMAIPNMMAPNFDVSETDNTFKSLTNNGPLATNVCGHTGTVAIYDPSVNIYNLTEIIESFLNCSSLDGTTGYTGFASVIDGTNADDTLWYATTNGSFSFYTKLIR